MSVLKNLQDQQSSSGTSSPSTSRLDAIEQQLTKLTKAMGDLTSYVKVMDEVHTTKLTALTSQQHGQPSTLSLDDETKRRLIEIEKTLAGIAQTVSDERVVKLSSGESVRASQLDSLALTTRIEKQVATMAQSSAELAEAVTKRGRVVIDTAKLEQHAVKVLDTRLTKAVEPSVARIEQTLSGFEQQVSVVGAGRASQAAQEVEAVVTKADAVVEAVKATERRVEALEGKVTWAALGRLALALLPLSAVLLVIGGLVGGIAHAAGFGPLLGWAWSSFADAHVWWHKALIALGTLTAFATFVRVVWWIAKRLADDFGHW